MALLFLGDNIYPKGLPNTTKANERLIAESKLTNQLKLSKNFRAKPYLYQTTIGTAGIRFRTPSKIYHRLFE
jgi:hypothetical protein